MTDETHEPEGKALPPREMMSLISTDPADPMYSTMLPAGPDADAPVTAETKEFNTLPVQPPADGTAEQTTTNVEQTDTASADS